MTEIETDVESISTIAPRVVRFRLASLRQAFEGAGPVATKNDRSTSGDTTAPMWGRIGAFALAVGLLHQTRTAVHRSRHVQLTVDSEARLLEDAQINGVAPAANAGTATIVVQEVYGLWKFELPVNASRTATLDLELRYPGTDRACGCRLLTPHDGSALRIKEIRSTIAFGCTKR